MNSNSSNNLFMSQEAAADNDVIAFQKIPLTALSTKSLRKLSNLLNCKKILRSEEGYERDWRGLAFLAKQKFLCDENSVNVDDPTKKVIQLWYTHSPTTATFFYLEHFLGIIDRWDVYDDVYENLVEDTKIYQANNQTRRESNSAESVDINSVNIYGDFGHGSDPNILTTSDVARAQKGLPPQMYDAFVLYADADLNYATEMLTKLEDNPQFNFKLCMKDRDLLGGVQFEHVALTQIIEERCKHLIVILTEEFLKSPENKFLVNYTQALQIQRKTRKIVPLLYEEGVAVPRTLKIYTHLRYNSGTASLFNFWSKLANSIQNVNGMGELATFSTSSPSNETSYPTTLVQQPNVLHSPSTQIPSISVIPPDDSEAPMKKTTMRIYKSKDDNNVALRAHTIGQLNTSGQIRSTASMCDLPAICGDTKKRRKWSTKILKKVFSRSSSKLQEA